MIPSTHVAGFKRWLSAQVGPRRRRMGRKEGKQDKRGDGRGKKGRRGVGEERRRVEGR